MDKVILAFMIGLTIFAANPVRAQDVAVEEIETTIESKTLKVLRISDRWIWLDAAAYGWKRFKLPDDFSFIIDSEAVGLEKIVVGQKLNVYITRTDTDWILLSKPGGVEVVEDTNKVVTKPHAKRKGKRAVTRTPDGYIINTEAYRVRASEPDAVRAIKNTNEVAGESPAKPIVVNLVEVGTFTSSSDYIISTGTNPDPPSKVDGARVVENTEAEKCAVLPGHSLKCHKRRAVIQSPRE